MSQNPYQVPDPFGTATTPPPYQPAGNPLMIPGTFLIVMSALWLLYGILNLLFSLSTGPPPVPPNQPPAFATGQAVGFYATVVAIPIVNLVILIGSVCMVRLKAYPMAMTAAILGLVPVCGPCLVLAIPIAIWALVLLIKPDVKALFS